MFEKAMKYKKILFFVNLPLILGIPCYVEWGLPLAQKEDLTLAYTVLHLTDFFLCFNSIIIYSVVSKMVTGIEYLPQEHKVKITQCKDWFLNEVTTLYDPKELQNCKKQQLNPFIGYKHIHRGSERLGTESTSVWHDR